MGPIILEIAYFTPALRGRSEISLAWTQLFYAVHKDKFQRATGRTAFFLRGRDRYRTRLGITGFSHKAYFHDLPPWLLTMRSMPYFAMRVKQKEPDQVGVGLS